jgi:NADPH-dependent 2,4-dienoyl-CoA reductase/sulfur reductase-like enzyme
MHLVVIGGSDAGISSALRARELDPTVDVTVIVADAYPNFSICGIPYYFSREVNPWQSLAHRTHADLEATGMQLRLDTLATRIDAASRQLTVRSADGKQSQIEYDELMVGIGASPSTAGIAGVGIGGVGVGGVGPDGLGPDDGVHVLHSMGDTFALERYLDQHSPETAIIVGAGYVGLEMAEALTIRGLHVTQLQRGNEVLSTLDQQLGSLVHDELTRHGVEVVTGARVEAVNRTNGHLTVTGIENGRAYARTADLVLLVVGVTPNTSLLTEAGATTGPGGAVIVDDRMRTGLPNVWAAGDGVVTHHRMLGVTYLPLGTTSHKQGRVAGENAIGGDARFAGSLGTQVVKVFDVVAARTGLRDQEAIATGHKPFSSTTIADDHKAYYPGAKPISIRITGATDTGLLLGAQMVGVRGAEIAKRIDTYATALHHSMTIESMSELDLSYTPPLGSPWDAVQIATQSWTRDRPHQLK